MNSKLPYKETRLTNDNRSHQLTNINVWTPDSLWIAYDIRPNGSSFTGLSIEKIHVNTLEEVEIYRANYGAHVGVVTVSSQHPLNMHSFMAQNTLMSNGIMTFIIAVVYMSMTFN